MDITSIDSSRVFDGCFLVLGSLLASPALREPPSRPSALFDLLSGTNLMIDQLHHPPPHVRPGSADPSSLCVTSKHPPPSPRYPSTSGTTSS